MNPDDSPILKRIRQGKWLPWLILAIGLVITYILYEILMKDAYRELQEEFNYQTRETIVRIERRMATYKLALSGASGLFENSKAVNHKEFVKYVERLKLEQNFPGVLTIGFVRLVPLAERERYIASMRRAVRPDYAIYPEGTRERYGVVQYAETFLRNRQVAPGFDMYSDPARRTAMEQASKLNEHFMSGKVSLVFEPEVGSQSGFLMYFPVHRSPGNKALVDRSSNITGWVYAAFRMDDFLAGVLKERNADLKLEIYDGDSPTPASLMTNKNQATPTSVMFESDKQVELAGRPWLIRIRSLPAFESRLDTTKPDLVMTAGLLISALLFLLVRQLIGSRERAVTLAQKMTHGLKESEQRWKFALDGAGDGVWDWYAQTSQSYFSSRTKTMLGFAENEISDDLAKWEQLIHPDDRAQVWTSVQAMLNGTEPTYACEFRLKCKDESWKWVLGRGMVVSRDKDGQPLRAIGTHADIDARKLAEAQIRRLSKLYATLWHCNQAIARSANEHELLAEVCRVAVEQGGMKMSFVAMVNPLSREAQVVASAGMDPEYRAGIEINVESESAYKDPAGLTIREKRPIWCQDFKNAPYDIPSKERATSNGWLAAASLPLYRNGETVGAFVIYSAEANVFGQEARELLEEMVQDINHALDVFDRDHQRNLAELALRKSEAFNTQVLNALVELIAVLDVEGNIIAANRGWREYAERNGPEEVKAKAIGQNYLQYLKSWLAGVNEDHKGVLTDGVRKVLSQEQNSFEMEYSRIVQGEEWWFRVHVTPLGEGLDKVVVTQENITQRKMAELEIISARTKLEELTGKLIMAQENERKSLARELHDELGQRFTMLNLGLHQMRPHINSEMGNEAWQQSSRELTSLIQRVRKMSGALRPQVLDYLGLEASVRQLLEQYFAETDVQYIFEYAGLPKKLPEQIEITAYRIVQESLTNIVRHADAKRVVIELNGGESRKEIEIRIRDNGKGFDPIAPKSSLLRNSFGIISMRERVILLGGKIEVKSRPGQGTQIDVLIPMQ